MSKIQAVKILIFQNSKIRTHLQAARTAAQAYMGWVRSTGGPFTTPSSLSRTYLRVDTQKHYHHLDYNKYCIKTLVCSYLRKQILVDTTFLYLNPKLKCNFPKK